jgi:hypothetical protein
MQRLAWVLIMCMCFVPLCKAQTDTSSLLHRADSITMANRMDVCDLAEKIVRHKLRITPAVKNENGPFYTILPSPGYSIATGFTGVLAGDFSFYAHKKYRGALSFFDYNFEYSQYRQVLTQINSILFFGHDKWQLNGDWRYLNFPTYTYGLGGFTTQNDECKINYSYLRVYETVLYRLTGNILAGIGYNLDYHFNVSLTGQGGAQAAINQYGLPAQSISSGPTINLIYDSRNDIHNPVTGTYFNFQLCMHQKPFASSTNWNSLIIDCRQYFKLRTRYRSSSLAFRAYLWLIPDGTAPYLDLPYTGGDTYGTMSRGYIEGRYRGPGLLYLEGEYRFAILKSELLGGVVFANVQTVGQWPGSNFAACLPGFGIGLRVMLNKFSNTKMSIDYGTGLRNNRGFAFFADEAF